MSYLFLVIAFKNKEKNKKHTSYWKLDDALRDDHNNTHNQGEFGLFHKWQSE